MSMEIFAEIFFTSSCSSAIWADIFFTPTCSSTTLCLREASAIESCRSKICVLLQQEVIRLQRGNVLLLGRLNILQCGDSRIRYWIGSFLVRKQFGQAADIRQSKIADIRQSKAGRRHRMDGRSSVYSKSEHRKRQDRFPARFLARRRGFGLFGLALLFRCLGHVHKPQLSEQKRAVAGWSVATAPLRGTQLELPEIIG